MGHAPPAHLARTVGQMVSGEMVTNEMVVEAVDATEAGMEEAVNVVMDAVVS